MDLKLLIKRNIIYGACPRCNEIATLDHLRISNSFLRFISHKSGFRKYHCIECKWTGLLFSYKISVHYKKILFIYLLIVIGMILFAFLISYLLKVKAR